MHIRQRGKAQSARVRVHTSLVLRVSSETEQGGIWEPFPKLKRRTKWKVVPRGPQGKTREGQQPRQPFSSANTRLKLGDLGFPWQSSG